MRTARYFYYQGRLEGFAYESRRSINRRESSCLAQLVRRVEHFRLENRQELTRFHIFITLISHLLVVSRVKLFRKHSHIFELSPTSKALTFVWSGSELSCYLRWASVCYGSNEVNLRKALWADLKRMSSVVIDQAWIVMGDLNSSRFHEEKMGGSGRSHNTYLHQCLLDIDLFDIPFKGPLYTWSNRRDSEQIIARKLAYYSGGVGYVSSSCLGART